MDETVVGGAEQGVRGRKNKKKKLVVVAIEKKNNGVSRFYAQVIERASTKEIGAFMKKKISQETQITTDQWPAYKPMS